MAHESQQLNKQVSQTLCHRLTVILKEFHLDVPIEGSTCTGRHRGLPYNNTVSTVEELATTPEKHTTAVVSFIPLSL